MLLSALLVANISSCNYVSEKKTDNTFLNTDTIESTNEITNDSEVPDTSNIETDANEGVFIISALPCLWI